MSGVFTLGSIKKIHSRLILPKKEKKKKGTATFRAIHLMTGNSPPPPLSVFHLDCVSNVDTVVNRSLSLSLSNFINRFRNDMLCGMYQSEVYAEEL